MRPLNGEPRATRSFDGTEITYHVTEGHGPVVLLAGGLVGGVQIWRHLARYLGAGYRFATWSYRDLSHDQPAPSATNPLDPIVTHARDLLAILDAENIDRCVWMAWSVGARVIIESLKMAPHRATHLVLLTPVFGSKARGLKRPIRTKLIEQLLDVLQGDHPVVESTVRRVARWPETVSWLKRLRMVAPTVDEDVLAEMIRSLHEADLPLFIRSVRETVERDVADVLSRIAVPSLVILGDRDYLAPQEWTEAIARRIAGVEVLVIRSATHFAALEFPELVNLRVEKFLREHGA